MGPSQRTMRPFVTVCFLAVVSFSFAYSQDVSDLSLRELQAIVDQLISPAAEYQLRRILEEQQLEKADDSKRSLSTLAKNGQLPTQQPETTGNDDDNTEWNDKRNVGSLARSGDYLRSGKRNIATLARDYQLPVGAGKRTAPLRYMTMSPLSFSRNTLHLNKFPSRPPTFNYKRSLSALRGSLVHGIVAGQDKRAYEGPFVNELESFNEFYPNYALLEPVEDAVEYQKEKRYLGRIFPPTRATSTTNRGRQ